MRLCVTGPGVQGLAHPWTGYNLGKCWAKHSVKLRFRVGSPGRQARIDVCLRGPCPTQLASCPLLKPFWKNSEFPGYPVPQFNNLSSLKAGMSVYLSIYHDPNLPKADFAVQLWEPCLTSLCSRWVSKLWLCSLYTMSVCLLCCSQQGLLTQRTDFLQPTAEATRQLSALYSLTQWGWPFLVGGWAGGCPGLPGAGLRFACQMSITAHGVPSPGSLPCMPALACKRRPCSHALQAQAWEWCPCACPCALVASGTPSRENRP